MNFSPAADWPWLNQLIPLSRSYMRTYQTPKAFAFLFVLLLLTLTVTAVGQENPSLVASASGEGTIKLGNKEFKLHAVVVKLFEDSKAELHLMTDITVFANGNWARGDDSAKEIELKITGNAVANIEGGGKIFLAEDRKSLKGLKLQMVNKISRKLITVDFTAD